ncbi:hypothetical protein [Amycolatopsis saalfeldensis]|uniref:Uncharacterized protein n=1 Tax=Amycolatopsis saalfeldensis TaxID=394193 RepID=A0A1H8XBS2_9PSEU|nr:hypothetical protein [Amycolatopsis saalfeldensis]SEP37424.1 hypothetical protein SAMN04489732_1078 [Amycolatopsis saalfeldensis]
MTAAESTPDTTVIVRHRLRAELVFAQPWLRRLLGAHSGLELDADGLRVRLGPWVVSTPVGNLAGAEVVGPFNPVKALGVRLSLADHGLTFAASAGRAVCIRFHRPVPGIEPTGLLRHPGLTVAVAGPELVAEAVNRIARP